MIFSRIVALSIFVTLVATGCFVNGSGGGGDDDDEYPEGTAKGSGVFEESTSFKITDSDSSTGIAIADLDKDSSHTDDIVVSNRQKVSKIYYTKAVSATSVLIEPAVELSGSSAEGGCNAVKIGDMDGDGNKDIFLGCSPGSSRVYQNKTNREFTAYTMSSLLEAGENCGSGDVNDLELIDMEADGKIDFVVTANTGASCIYQVVESGDFIKLRSKKKISDASASASVAACDLNNDALIDIIFGKTGDNLAYLANDSGYAQAFTPATITAKIGTTNGIGCLKRTSESLPDLFFADSNPGSYIYVSQNHGATFSKDVSQEFAGGKTGEAVVIQDFNADDYPDIFVAVSGNEMDELWLYDQNAYVDSSANLSPRSAAISRAAVSFDIDRNGTPDLMVARDGRNIIYLNRPQQ